MLWFYHRWLLFNMPAFYACFLESFYHKWVLNFVKSILSIYWDNMIFIFQFVNIVYHIDWSVHIEESLHPWDKAHLIMMYDLFNVLFDSLMCYCLLEFWGFLNLCSSVILACNFLFVASLVWFQSDGGLVKWLWEFSFPCNFL